MVLARVLEAAVSNVISDDIGPAELTTLYRLSLADTRTDDSLALGNALLQHQHSGVLPSSNVPLPALPLLDPLSSTSMPESWVRGAILIRMNSLIRGHSGVRWELIEKLGELLHENITPLVPLRGSISASGGMSLTPSQYLCSVVLNFRVRSFPAVVHRWHTHREPLDPRLRRSCQVRRAPSGSVQCCA